MALALTSIQSATKTALETAGLTNVITQRIYPTSIDQVKDQWFDKSQDPPRINFTHVEAISTRIDRRASKQNHEYGQLTITYVLAVNDNANTRQKFNDDMYTILTTMGTFFNFAGDLVDMCFPPSASQPVEKDVLGYACLQSTVTLTFMKPLSVSYT